jgi:hypothetical protein
LEIVIDHRQRRVKSMEHITSAPAAQARNPSKTLSTDRGPHRPVAIRSDEMQFRGEEWFMTKLIEQAVAAVSRLPQETQDDLARLLLALAEGATSPLTRDEAAAIAEAEAEIARGERVPPETVAAFWRAQGL